MDASLRKYRFLAALLALAFALLFSLGAASNANAATVNVSNITYSSSQGYYLDYNGEEQHPSYTFRCSQLSNIQEGVDFDVTYPNSVDVGEYQAKIVGKGRMSGTRYISYAIRACAIYNCELSITPNRIVYDGKAHTPTVTLTCGNYVLKEGTDYYFAADHPNGPYKNAGIYIIAVDGIGNFTSEASDFFIIDAQPLVFKGTKLAKTSYTYNGKNHRPALVFGSKILNRVKGVDYSVYYENSISIGTHTAYVSGINNYSGDQSFSYTVRPQKVTIRSFRKISKGAYLRATWGPVGGNVDGYEIQISMSKKFSKKVTRKISSLEYREIFFGNPKAKKTYRLRIRAYKTVKGKTYKSAWSKVKTVRT